MGGYQDTSAADYSEPAGGWRWVTGEPWKYTNWAENEPNNSGDENYLQRWNYGRWNDTHGEAYWHGGYLVEWSADCNADGIVDFGQIRAGTLSDVNHSSIPDECECLADIFIDGLVNGADLGIVLSQWGQGAGAIGDINRDGIVDGADLAIVLGTWGPCGN
jgi:hypothetical protein